MFIAIDASRAVNETAGIGRYCLQLIKKLIEIDKTNHYLLLFTYFQKDSKKEKIINGLRQANVDIKTIMIPGQLKEKLWGWRLPLLSNLTKNSDIFYAPSFFEVNMGLKTPQIVTIYDLTTFLFPSHRGKEVSKRLNLRTKIACLKAQKIIVISKSTKNDLIKILKISQQKIQVICPGRTEFLKCAKNLPAGLKRKSFILTVGTIEPRKNLIGLFKAYALLAPQLQEKYPLVIVGAKGWNSGDIYEVIKNLKIIDKIKFLGFVSDLTLAKLYKEAAVFAYPSLYEGFGFPVLEAMGFGTPVVTSNVSSLPEVAGKAAILVDPHDPQVISSGIQRLLEHNQEAIELGKRGLIQAKKFSWEKAARETLKVFREVSATNN